MVSCLNKEVLFVLRIVHILFLAGRVISRLHLFELPLFDLGIGRYHVVFAIIMGNIRHPC